ncbi:hypothetical protein LTR53_016785 [Teratosphaeriaceae sp. CCFEE 6253]|nr:hypothetical protein LTR53_016785 [Teratosphaeriaceae sp. CCFEE 6253]
MSNGLCYNPAPGVEIWGRYTCTDRTWQAARCPQVCTQGNTAVGDEALLQCADGSWCCDGDRSFNCCTTANTDFFLLDQGTSYASITSVPSPTPASSGLGNSPASTTLGTPTGGANQQQQTSSSTGDSSATGAAASASSSAQQSPTPASADPTTSSTAVSTLTSEAVTTNTDGSQSTLVVYSTVSAAGSSSTQPPKNTPPNSSPSHLGLIIGLAVGIPLLLLACALLTYLLYRRRKAHKSTALPSSPSSEEHQAVITTDKYGHQVGHDPPPGRTPEIDSYPVALRRTQSGHKSELEGSSLLQHSPAMSGGGGGGGSPKPPPGYSPAHAHAQVTPNLQAVAEEPAELWGGYVPYRPPRGELADGRTS